MPCFLLLAGEVLVLLNIGSLAPDDPFLVVFILSFTTSFENLGVLCTISFLSSQDLFPVLCIISFLVGTPTNGLLVILRRLIGALHFVWRLTNNELNPTIAHSYKNHIADSVITLKLRPLHLLLRHHPTRRGVTSSA